MNFKKTPLTLLIILKQSIKLNLFDSILLIFFINKIKCINHFFSHMIAILALILNTFIQKYFFCFIN
jgi:hypothetical protein